MLLIKLERRELFVRRLFNYKRRDRRIRLVLYSKSLSEARALSTRCVASTISPDMVRQVAIKERTIHKTTSGKIQRRRNRQQLHAGKLSVVMELTAPVRGNGKMRCSTEFGVSA